MATKKVDHKRFLDLCEKIEANAERSKADRKLTHESVMIIVEHAHWFKSYIDGQKKASKSRVNPGRKPLPDEQVKPESLRRRELRKKK